MARPRRSLSRTTQAITTDRQLKHEEKVKNHTRKQKFEDAVGLVSVWAVVVIPAGVLILGTIYLIHLALVHDWDTFRAVLQPIAYATGGYLLSALQRKGLHHDS